MIVGRDMFEMAAALARRPVESVTALGDAMLAHSARDSFDPHPTGRQAASASLNPEGIPIELAITASSERLKFRLVVDPAAMNGDPAERCRRGRAALRKALALNGTDALDATLADLLDAMLPDDPARLAAYGSGPFCMAAALGEPGAAIYIDARTHGADAFARASLWLEERLPDAREALRALAAMRPFAHLAAVGLEGTAPDRALAKLYWRLEAPVALPSLGVEAFAHPDFLRFLALAMGDRTVPSSGLMLAAGFRMDDGSLHDAKVNLCGHCLAWGNARWPDVVDGCTQAFGLSAIPAGQVLARPNYDVSFLTFGRTGHGARRINCYLRPTARH